MNVYSTPQMKHVNIVAFDEAFRQDSEVCIVMEYCEVNIMAASSFISFRSGWGSRAPHSGVQDGRQARARNAGARLDCPACAGSPVYALAVC